MNASSGVYGVCAAPGHNWEPAGAMSTARAREMGPGAANLGFGPDADRHRAGIEYKKTVLMGEDRGALARVRQGHNRATRRGIWGAGAVKWARKRDRRHDDGKFGSRVARPQALSHHLLSHPDVWGNGYAQIGQHSEAVVTPFYQTKLPRRPCRVTKCLRAVASASRR